jgi:hypothetical protein
MKLISHSQLKKLCRISLGLILMILPVIILLVVPSIDFSLLALLGIIILMASFVMGILIIFCNDDEEYKFLHPLFTKIGIVSPYTIFDRLERGDLILFEEKQYDGTSDIPKVINSQTWMICPKGKHYIQYQKIYPNHDDDQVCNALPEKFGQDFEKIMRYYNVITLGDKVIYSQL